MFICDTFDISLNQIAPTHRDYTTVKISSQKKGDGLRYNNPKLVATVRSEVQKIVEKGKEINLFMATNPLNTKKIIGTSFLAIDRSGFEKITVIQMDDSKTYTEFFNIFTNK